MLKSRTGKDQSVHSVTCAICAYGLTLVMLKMVVRLPRAASTSKYGSSSVAAGAPPPAISHESSLQCPRHNAAAPIVIENGAFPVQPLCVTMIVKLDTPVVVGVPVIAPVAGL